MIWTILILIIVVPIVYAMIYGFYLSNKDKNQQVLFKFESSCVVGVPNMEPGEVAEIVLKKEVLMINDTQIIPYSRILSVEHIHETEIKLDEKEKSVILRAVMGGALLGPIGAIVGGISGVGNKKVEEKIEQNYIQIEYENVHGEFVKALFLTRYWNSFCDGIVKKFYEVMGREFPKEKENIDEQKLIRSYEI
ncbi:hypothetical protein [Paenibacillus bouchesdurhonensis]|uniref:hypothetical protein n=1 Tax=Paenibacillus bouchesdurhonensis TaxID=1870990 RepID=UPI000DA5F7E0|nr:hypothetical protein [Paenibacillus bouchesdurhonensis]